MSWLYKQKGALSLDLGRLATGYGMGIFSYVVPVFTAEIAPKELRGALTSANQVKQENENDVSRLGVKTHFHFNLHPWSLDHDFLISLYQFCGLKSGW